MIMANFCGKCGHPVNENGLCPNCDTPVAPDMQEQTIEPEKKKEEKKEQEYIPAVVVDYSTYFSNGSKKAGRVSSGFNPARLIAIILVIALLLGGGALVLLNLGAIDKGTAIKPAQAEDDDSYKTVIDTVIGAYPWDDKNEPVPGIEGISPLLRECKKLEDLSYALKDIDNNGTQELILAKKENGEFRIINIITELRKSALVLAGAQENSILNIADDGTIIEESSNGGDQKTYDSFVINDSGDGIDFENRVTFDKELAVELGYADSTDEVSDEDGWFYTEDIEDENSYEKISETKANAFVGPGRLNKDISFAPITEYESNDHKKPEKETNKDEKPVAPDTEKKEEPTYEPEKNYSVTYESSYTHQYIQSINPNLGVVYVEEGNRTYLLDYSGNIMADCTAMNHKYEEYGTPFYTNYCDSVCNIITDHNMRVDPVTFEVDELPSGHGGYSLDFFYDAASQKIYTMDFGYIEEYTENIDFAVVTLVEKRPATEEEKEWYGKEFGLEILSKYGIVVNSRLVVPCEYDCYTDYSNGVCALSKNGKWGYFNENGEKILDFEYDPSDIETWIYSNNDSYKMCVPYSASYGLIPVYKNGMWGYSDTDGNMVTDFEFEKALPSHRGKAWVKHDGVWKVISFDKYEGGISVDEAKAVLDDIFTLTDTVSSIVIVPLPENEWESHYLAKAPCFSVTFVYIDSGSYTNYYKVLDDGEIVYFEH